MAIQGNSKLTGCLDCIPRGGKTGIRPGPGTPHLPSLYSCVPQLLLECCSCNGRTKAIRRTNEKNCWHCLRFLSKNKKCLGLKSSWRSSPRVWDEHPFIRSEHLAILQAVREDGMRCRALRGWRFFADKDTNFLLGYSSYPSTTLVFGTHQHWLLRILRMVP